MGFNSYKSQNYPQTIFFYRIYKWFPTPYERINFEEKKCNFEWITIVTEFTPKSQYEINFKHNWLQKLVFVWLKRKHSIKKSEKKKQIWKKMIVDQKKKMVSTQQWCTKEKKTMKITLKQSYRLPSSENGMQFKCNVRFIQQQQLEKTI